MKKIYLFVITNILFISVSSAQAVTVTNPTNTTPNLAATYTSLANAITALNAITAISGPVTITLNVGYGHTAPAGGYIIQFAATATAATPITITGNDQMIFASPALTIGSLNDGIFKIIGADYITLKDFVMVENSLNTTTGGASPANTTTGNNMTEFGVALLRASPTDGPQHNTIQDNFISLNKTYTNTFGIYSNSRASATAVATTSDITSVTGSSFGNKIYSNTITNVNFGIVFNGSGVATQMDDDNDIGGASAFTGNSITNWGSAGTAVSGYPNITGSNYCIFVNQQTNDNISYNTIIGATHTTTNTHGGILKTYSLGQPTGTITSTISNNFITLTSSNGTSSMTVIQSMGLTALSTATININDNTIDDCAITGVTTTPNFIGISNSSAPGILNMNDNIIRGTTSTATTGGFTGLTNTGAVTTTINISNNQIGINSSNAVTFSNALNANIIAINNSSGTTGTTLNMNDNIIRGLSGVSNAGVTYGISNSAVNSLAINISDNTLGNSSRNFITYTAASAGQVYGIINTGGGSTTNLTITNNKIDRINGVSFSNTLAGITNGSGLIGGTLDLNNNAIGTTTGTFLTTTASSSGNIYAMYNSNGASTCTVNMNNNTIDGLFINSTSVNLTVMALNGSNVGTAMMSGNSFGSTGTLINFAAAQPSGGTFRVMDLGTGSSNATSTITCQNNTVRNIIFSTTSLATSTCIFINASPLTATISGNQFNNLSLNVAGNAWMILDFASRTSGQTLTVNNNSIVTGLNKSASGNAAYGFYNGGSSVNGATSSITNNNFSNITVTGATTIYGIRTEDGLSSSNGPTDIITGNTLNNLSGSGAIYGIYADYTVALTCSSNTISNLSTSGDINGIYFGTNNGAATHLISNNTISGIASTGGGVSGMVIQGTSNYSSVNVHSNQVSGLSGSGTSFNLYGIYFVFQQVADIHDNVFHNFSASGSGSVTVYGIFSGFGATVNIYGNKVYDIVLTGTPTSGSLDGIFSVMSTTAYNNFIADLRAPSLNGFPGVRGFYYAAFFPGTYCNFYHNSIYLNTSSTGTDFGSAAFMTLANTDPTVGMLTMIDNILVNTSASTGTGKTAAFYRLGSNLSNFSGSSDYNLLYAGTPGASKLIYYDTTNSCQTLTAYQAIVSTRDANAISLMPTFVSATDLHLTSANCRIDGRGTPIGSVTTDIDATARNATTPDIGADEFTATTSTTLAGVAGSAVCEDRTVAVSGTTFTSNACDPIARILSSGADPVAGKVNVCVTLDATQQYFNGEPYVQRHFDMEPTTSNQTTTSATITLYFTDAEFVLYNSTNPVVWPRLPTAVLGNADPNRANLKITQFHGAATTSPSSPGNYPGVKVLIDPVDANVFWNGTYWEITFNVAGFSGFYVHTNNFNAPLPIVVNYLTGRKQGSNHLLNWKVTCAGTPRATMTLERSSDARNYSGIYTITADAARCQQPFDHTDADPLKGMNFYRLKIVDADGHITYSTTVALLNAVKGFDIVSIAPNPVVSNNFKLNVASAKSSKMELVIFDMQGRMVNRQTVSVFAGYNSLPIHVTNLSSGTYTIQGTIAEDKIQTDKVCKTIKINNTSF